MVSGNPEPVSSILKEIEGDPGRWICTSKRASETPKPPFSSLAYRIAGVIEEVGAETHADKRRWSGDPEAQHSRRKEAFGLGAE